MADIELLPDRTLNGIVAGMCRTAVREQAESLAEQARAKLLLHRKTGEAQIEVQQDDVDSYVELVDVNPRGVASALSIEYGHGAYQQKRRRKNGTEYTIRVGASEGLHVLGGLIP